MKTIRFDIENWLFELLSVARSGPENSKQD